MTRTKIATVFVAGLLCLAAWQPQHRHRIERTQGRPAADECRAGRNAPQSNRIRLEHVGLNVADPIKTAQWYVDHLGMKILREGPAPINARFLADADGNMMFEFYHNPPDAVPNYASMDPLVLHVAFHGRRRRRHPSQAPGRGRDGRRRVTITPAGDKITMLRDPWGLAIQFIRRADPMLLAQVDRLTELFSHRRFTCTDTPCLLRSSSFPSPRPCRPRSR